MSEKKETGLQKDIVRGEEGRRRKTDREDNT
jgi:hypothetical protein